MSTQELAYFVWQLLFNRPVSGLTSREIYEHCAAYQEKCACEPECGPPTAEGALRTLPPTYDEITPVAEEIHSSQANDSAEADWEQAAVIVLATRGE